MYGPAVRCKSFVDLVVSGLASMYPVSSWSCCAPDHHGYQRACDLVSGQASMGPFGSPVFACAGKTDPPSRLVLSQTSAGKLLLGYVTTCSSSRVRHSSGLGGCLVDLPRFEASSASQNAPCDAGQLVGESDRKDVVMQPFFGRIEPRLEPVTFPTLRFDQHDPCGLHEPNAQTAI